MKVVSGLMLIVVGHLRLTPLNQHESMPYYTGRRSTRAPNNSSALPSDWTHGLDSHGDRANSDAGPVRATDDTADGARR